MKIDWHLLESKNRWTQIRLVLHILFRVWLDKHIVTIDSDTWSAPGYQLEFFFNGDTATALTNLNQYLRRCNLIAHCLLIRSHTFIDPKEAHAKWNIAILGIWMPLHLYTITSFDFFLPTIKSIIYRKYFLLIVFMCNHYAWFELYFLFSFICRIRNI